MFNLNRNFVYLSKVTKKISLQFRPFSQELLDACKINDNGKVKTLLENGHDPNYRGLMDITPLIVACQNKGKATIDTLLDHKDTKINLQDASGFTALMYACQNGLDFLTIKTMVLNGANPKIKNNNNETVVDIARERLLNTQQWKSEFKESDEIYSFLAIKSSLWLQFQNSFLFPALMSQIALLSVLAIFIHGTTKNPGF